MERYPLHLDELVLLDLNVVGSEKEIGLLEQAPLAI